MRKTVQQVILEFEQEYPDLIDMSLSVFTVFTADPPVNVNGRTISAEISQGLSHSDQCPNSATLSVLVPIIFDYRKAPEYYQGLRIEYGISMGEEPFSDNCGSIPEEFSEGNEKGLFWDEKFSPENFQAFVERCPELIRKKLGQPSLTK